jgi:glycosyltransferase involved in cell wall biosynthesis
MKILILSHGHPALFAGGAERAAYSLFEHLSLADGIEPTFVARAPHELIGHDADFGMFRGKANEILVCLPEVDNFTFQSTNYNKLRSQLIELVDRVKPDLVHAHHFVYFGIEVFEIFKELGVPVILTLHEYLGICHNFGQMVKTNGRLCHVSSPMECSLCFPKLTPGNFFLRERMLKIFLSCVDVFLAPSEFLARRYAEWGIDPNVIRIVENPLPPALLREIVETSKSGPEVQSPRLQSNRLKLGFFGQLNPFKGPQVLLEAIALLPLEVRENLYVGVHGANLEIQAVPFQERMRTLLTSLSGIVADLGPYDNSDAVALMRQYDWIVVPSIWWENSPVVIQEARAAGVPVMGSNIGGIGEKISSSACGGQFEVGSPSSLAKFIHAQIGKPVVNRTKADELVREQAAAIQEIIKLYRALK